MGTPTRRQFIAAGGLGAAALAANGAEAPRRGRPMTLGLPTYMFKHYTLDQTLAMAQRVAVQHLCIRSNLLALDSTDAEIMAAVAKVKAAGLVPYGGGVIYMKDEASVARGFDYARAAGFGIISINIRPDLLPLLERKVREFDIQAAIHNHGPEDRHYPTPQAIYEKIRTLDRRIGICHDTGHTRRAGVDPVEATRKTADRILDVHLKDVDAATRQGHSTELGRGIVDLPGILRALRDTGYAGVVGIEYEKHMQDLLPGLAESVGYARGVLAVVQPPGKGEPR
jgi:hypothetical protein